MIKDGFYRRIPNSAKGNKRAQKKALGTLYSPNRSFFHGPDNISHVISCSRQPTQRSKFQHRFVNLPGRIGKWARTIWKYQPYPTHILIRFLCNHEFTKEKKQHKSWSGEYTDAILTRLSAEMSTSGSAELFWISAQNDDMQINLFIQPITAHLKILFISFTGLVRACEAYLLGMRMEPKMT